MSRRHSTNTRAWRRTRDRVFRRDGRACSVPGCPGVRLEVDHVDPFGTDDLSNLRVLCRDHHIKRHARPITEHERAWRAFVDELSCQLMEKIRC